MRGRGLAGGRVRAIPGGNKKKEETFCSHSLPAQLPWAKDTACEAQGKHTDSEDREPGK